MASVSLPTGDVGHSASPKSADVDGDSLIERTRQVKVDANDYSRFKSIGADLDDDDDDTRDHDERANATRSAGDVTCRNCRRTGAKLKCSVCKKAVYCARRCQASDWQFHKRICKQPERPKTVAPPGQPAAGRSTSRRDKPKQTKKSSAVVVADEPDLPKSMRGYKNGLPYFHRELSTEEKNLIGDIAPQKIDVQPAAVRVDVCCGRRSLWMD